MSNTHEYEKTIGDQLRQRGWRLAVAESCTGGLLGDRITNVPGSSTYFMGGIIAYAYEAKVRLLGVSWDTLEEHGAVSEPVVLEMARGARKSLSVDIGISISGVAGPGGGTEEKPVGTTWIGLSTPDGERAWQFVWDGDRVQNKVDSVDKALELLHAYLEDRDYLQD